VGGLTKQVFCPIAPWQAHARQRLRNYDGNLGSGLWLNDSDRVINKTLSRANRSWTGHMASCVALVALRTAAIPLWI
jgi:hypothetical protein